MSDQEPKELAKTASQDPAPGTDRSQAVQVRRAVTRDSVALARTQIGDTIPSSVKLEPVDARLGSLLLDKYRIEELIGRGGCGRVYRAVHVLLKTVVAIKFLLPEVMGSATARARFVREAQILARLSHPGIVAVHDFGEDNQEPYLVMEFVVGQTLDRRMQMSALLPFAQIVRITDQVLAILDAAHQQAIIHRDIKPGNVMLASMPQRTETEEWSVKLLDFGLAQINGNHGPERLTRTGAIFGTLQYMSPEQCRGDVLGPPSDVYSVGVMLYELLAGDLPFQSDNPADLMTEHVHVEPPPLDQRNDGSPVPPALAAVALWALAKTPERRPRIDEFRDRLVRALAGTDPVSVLQNQTAQRTATAARSRDERALTRPDVTGQVVPVSAGESQDSSLLRVCLLGWPAERARVIRDALAVQGLRPMLWTQVPAHVAAWPRLFVLFGDANAMSILESLRQNKQTAAIPVMVADLQTPAVIPLLIRAGASDAILLGGDDTDLTRKI